MAKHRNNALTVAVPIEMAPKGVRFNLLLKPAERTKLEKMAGDKRRMGATIRQLVFAAYQDPSLLVITEEAKDTAGGKNFQIVMQEQARDILDQMAVARAEELGAVNRSTIVRALILAAWEKPESFGVRRPKNEARRRAVAA